MVHTWDYMHTFKDGVIRLNYGAPGTRIIIDDAVPGIPTVPNFQPGDRVKLTYVGGDNALALTFSHPDFFMEAGTAPVQNSLDPQHIP